MRERGRVMNRKTCVSAIIVSLLLGVGCAGIALAAQQLPLATADAKSKLDAAHEKTIAAATRAHDSAGAATDALCRQDRAAQTRARTNADTAQKDFEASAQAEADENPEIAQARYALIGATYAMNGSH